MKRRIGCAALALALLATACTKVNTASGGLHPWTRPGVLRIGVNYDVKSLNPVLDGSALALDVSMFVFSWSVRYDAQGNPVPDALREIPTVANGDVSKDGLTLIYKLRPNIEWQDGKPLTCEDLKFTWRYVMDPKTNIAVTDGYRDIASIDCKTPLVAVIHMKRLYAPYLQQLWSVNSNAPILPEHILAPYLAKGTQNTAPFNSMPIGSGPFRVIQWERGTVVRLAANPNYFLGKPKLNEVDIYTEPDENTLETQIQTHAIDMLARGTAINWPRYQALAAQPNSGLKAILADSYAYDHIDFNVRNPILSDLQVRRALTYATNRPEIIAKIFHGADVPSDSPEQPALSWGYTADTMHYGYDPAKARALLDADGWRVGPDGIRIKNGQRLEFTLSAATESTLGKAIQDVVQREWHDIGVQADVKNYPTPEFFANGDSGVLEGGHYDAAIFAWMGAADPDLDPLYSDENLAPRGQDSLFWQNPAASRALADGLTSIDESKRKADYAVFQQQLALDAPTIIIGFRKVPFVYNTDLQGFDPSPVISPFWDPWEYSM
ncbi:MAG TPA: peptide ABC transporter substrate-binding protein [Candidatus Acidoferrales bacterium]|nr:peptide ABC transporter substrate-binding protein [Candidatus Acidoferrales bacterium]